MDSPCPVHWGIGFGSDPDTVDVCVGGWRWWVLRTDAMVLAENEQNWLRMVKQLTRLRGHQELQLQNGRKMRRRMVENEGDGCQGHSLEVLVERACLPWGGWR